MKDRYYKSLNSKVNTHLKNRLGLLQEQRLLEILNQDDPKTFLATTWYPARN